MKKQFRDFESAREFVRCLELKSGNEWREYCKSGNKPNDIPSNLDKFYKNKGWKGWGDFLGTGNVANKNKVYRQFKEARDFVRKLNLKNQKEWQEYCKSGDKPDDIPADPLRVYKNKGWKGYGDFLGNGNVAPFNIRYRPFQEAREFVRKLGIKNRREWNEYCKSGNKPDDIPANPWITYKEWRKNEKTL